MKIKPRSKTSARENQDPAYSEVSNRFDRRAKAYQQLGSMSKKYDQFLKQVESCQNVTNIPGVLTETISSIHMRSKIS